VVFKTCVELSDFEVMTLKNLNCVVERWQLAELEDEEVFISILHLAMVCYSVVKNIEPYELK
jgi:hypothetical protein